MMEKRLFEICCSIPYIMYNTSLIWLYNRLYGLLIKLFQNRVSASLTIC